MNLGTFKDFLPLIGGGGALGILEVARRLWLDSRKSKLQKPDAFKLPQIPESTAIYQQDFSEADRFLVGRGRDTAVLTRILQENPLVFVDGPSGVGKSTLLKLGVARRLMQAGAWLPVYVDIWGVDWVDGPRQALADALQVAVGNGLEEAQRKRLGLNATVTIENLWRTLEGLRAECGRRPVLIFDQIDDYQNRHWQCFKGDDDALISTVAILERNAFWMDINRLCQSSVVHIAFVVRSDSAICLNSLRFHEPKTFRLARLESADARSLINNLVAEDAVVRPENGFEQLKDLIAEELQEAGADPGVLPIQMRVALSGLSSLTRLTPAHLKKVGGIEGLEAAYVEKHARRTSAGASTVLRVLLQLVTQSVGDINKTTSRALPELVEASQLSPNEVRHILESLEDAQIVRRRLDPGRGEVWQLYHDYLARAVIRLDRKDREGELLLAANAKTFGMATGPWDKARTLLAPLDQIRLFRDRLQGRMVYRPHGGYALLSLPRLILNVPVLLVFLGFGGTVYGIQQHLRQQEQDQERLAESRLLDAQAALRRHDLATALEAFGAAIDYLPPSDPRASAALAGIVSNIANVPRMLSNVGPVRAAALSVDADKIIVRRLTGQVQVFEGTTGRKLPAPDVGLLHNSFEWMNFMDRYPIEVSDDGTLASLVFPAEALATDPTSERRHPWIFTQAVWRVGSDKLLWRENGKDSSAVFYGPRGYVLIRAQDKPTVILRVGQNQVDTIQLSGGVVAHNFPPTGESFIVWFTGGPNSDRRRNAAGETRMALVDVDKIPSGYSGPVPESAILWAHSVVSFSGQVRWQGYTSKPAFLFSSADKSWYCDLTACKEITVRDHPVVEYAAAPTMGVQLATGKDADEKKPGTTWAQGPGPETRSFVENDFLQVRDMATGVEQVLRSIGTSVVARGWNRSGGEFWVINGDGEVVSFPIRAPRLSSSIGTRPTTAEDRERTTFSPRHDRSLTIQSSKATDELEINSTWLGIGTNTHKTWKAKLSGVPDAWFSVDGKYVILRGHYSTFGHAEDKVKVTVLSAETGEEWAAFETHGWMLQGDVRIGETRRLAQVSRFSVDGTQSFAICEWSEAGLSRCSKPLDGHDRISNNGKYFVEIGPHTTAFYASSELGENQSPLFELSGTTSRQRFDRALVEFVFSTSDSVLVSKHNGATELTAELNGRRVTASITDYGGVSVRVGNRALRFPANSFENNKGLWGPEVLTLELASDGRRMIVKRGEVSQDKYEVKSEVWDVESGTVLAVLPPLGNFVPTFGQGNETVRLNTDKGIYDLLSLSPGNAVPPSWASGAAMSVLVRGKEAGRWRTRDDVLRSINKAAELGDPVSKRVSRMVGEAWSR